MKAKNLFFAYCLSMIPLSAIAQVAEYTVATTGEKIEIDPTELAFTASPNHTEPGRTIVNNQGIYFGWFLTPGVTEAVDARWSLWQGNRLITLGESRNLQLATGGNNGRRMPLFINVPTGKYTLKPLLKRPNNSYWNIPHDYSSYDDWNDDLSYKNWEYNIEDINTHKAPSVLLLCSESLSDELVEGVGIPTLFNQPEERSRYERFNAFVRFSNKANNTKEGRIKLMYERNFEKFWLGYSKSNASIQTNWSVSITKGATMNGVTDWDDKGLPISIPAKTKDIRFDIKGCYASDYYSWGTTYTPYVHVYFQPEGSNEWILCGIDAAGDFDANHAVIPSVYQKNCNSFALWISDATDNSVASDKESLAYDSAAKTLAISNVPDRSYVFIYNLDGKTVKAEPTIIDGKYTFNTSSISPGAYLIKIISGTAVRTFKLNL